MRKRAVKGNNPMGFTELELIRWLRKNAPTIGNIPVGIGDDAAVLPMNENEYQLLKVDAIAEGIHYLPSVDPRLVGHKALARPLSDIAAMGGVPKSAVVSFAVDGSKDFESIKLIFRGLYQLAKRYRISVVGGETIRLKHGVVISVSVLGTVEKKCLVTRKGALDKDKILITGTIGAAARQKHLSFTPRLEESRWLVGHFNIHSMIDISDGLAGDLMKILKESGTGAVINLDKLPLTKGVSSRKGVEALRSGEEYELLFTADGKTSEEIVSARHPWKTEVTIIGEITKEKEKIYIIDNRGNKIPFSDKSYDHFSV